jgi:hypothetical protein
LFSAIDAQLDPSFDPNNRPRLSWSLDEADIPKVAIDPESGIAFSIYTLTDPVLRKKYADRREKAAREGEWFNDQSLLRRVDRAVVKHAEDYFKSEFVRSLRSVAIIDSCAESGKWAPERRKQVRAWVQPKE